MMTIPQFADEQDFSEYRQFDPHSKYIDPKRILNKIANNEIIISKEDNTIVGMIRLSYIWSTRPYIEFIYVKEDKRKKGTGSELLLFLEKYLVENEYTYLFSSSEEQDETAIKWHLKKGFTQIGKLSDLNLPFSKTSEIFFIKKISDINKLRKYPVL